MLQIMCAISYQLEREENGIQFMKQGLFPVLHHIMLLHLKDPTLLVFVAISISNLFCNEQSTLLIGKPLVHQITNDLMAVISHHMKHEELMKHVTIALGNMSLVPEVMKWFVTDDTAIPFLFDVTQCYPSNREIIAGIFRILTNIASCAKGLALLRQYDLQKYVFTNWRNCWCKYTDTMSCIFSFFYNLLENEFFHGYFLHDTTISCIINGVEKAIQKDDDVISEGLNVMTMLATKSLLSASQVTITVITKVMRCYSTDNALFEECCTLLITMLEKELVPAVNCEVCLLARSFLDNDQTMEEVAHLIAIFAKNASNCQWMHQHQKVKELLLDVMECHVDKESVIEECLLALLALEDGNESQLRREVMMIKDEKHRDIIHSIAQAKIFRENIGVGNILIPKVKPEPI